jgi:hypothetical protein
MFSFFFVSTEMTGSPASMYFEAPAFICSNCAFLSSLVPEKGEVQAFFTDAG